VSVTVRPLVPEDRTAWDPLWAAYLVFYEEDLAPEITEVTWSRFHDPAEPMWAIGAVDDEGRLLGICHFLFHRTTWSATWSCYLEDLFTVAEARGRGVGRALIEATAEAARRAGATTLHWQTQATNTTARSLYDQVARHEGHLVYERSLEREG
jgi:GNAT superfamily N-acetyltransferase